MSREDEQAALAAHTGALQLGKNEGRIAVTAATAKDYFVALTTEGFTEEQAIEIVKTTLSLVLLR